MGSLTVFLITEGSTLVSSPLEAADWLDSFENRRYSEDLMTTIGNMLQLQPQKRPSAEEIQKDIELNNREYESVMIIQSSQVEEFVRLLQDFKDSLPHMSSDLDVEGQIFRWEESTRRKASQEQLLDVSPCLDFLGRVFSEAFKQVTPHENGSSYTATSCNGKHDNGKTYPERYGRVQGVEGKEVDSAVLPP